MSSSAVLRCPNSASGLRQKQQVRGFRSGLWSSYLDPAFHREMRRRARTTRYAYAEALKRQYLWERDYIVPPRRWGLKAFMCKAWVGHDARPGGRYINMDELRRWSAGERDEKHPPASDFSWHLRDNRRRFWDAMQDHSNWVRRGMRNRDTCDRDTKVSQEVQKSTAQPVSDTETTQTQFKQSQPSEPEPETQLQYDIDPITNRKVFRDKVVAPQLSRKESGELPVKTFKGYRAQFTQFAPPEPEKVADGVTQVQKPLQEDQKLSEELKRYVPYEFNEPHGQVVSEPDPIAESLKDYDSVEASEAQASTLNASSSSDRTTPKTQAGGITGWFRRLGETVTGQESTNKVNTSTVSSITNPSESELKLYQPYAFNEPDGHPPQKPDPVADALKEYDSKLENGQAVEYEAPKATGITQDYDDLHKYEPFMFDERTEETLLKGSRSEDPTDSKQYQPFAFNEPEGQIAQSEDTWAERLPDSEAYKPYKFNEPNGQVSQPIDTFSERKADSDYYEPFKFNEPHGQVSQPSANEHQNEKRYTPFEFNEPHGQVPTIEDPRIQHFKDSGDYEPFMYNEPDGKVQPEQDTVAQSLKEYDSQCEWTKPAKSKTTLQSSQVQRSKFSALDTSGSTGEDLEELRASDVRASVGKTKKGNRSLTGNFVRDFPEEFSTSWTIQKGQLTPNQPSGSITNIENDIQQAERVYASNVNDRNISANRLQPSLERTTTQTADDTSSAQAHIDPYSKEPQGLETCYAKECAEEFGGPAPAFSSFYGSVKDDGSSVATTSDTKSNLLNDPELEQEIRDIYESSYGTITSSHRQPSNEHTEAVRAQNAEPTFYKVLAYNHDSDTVEVAETSSIVPDDTLPLRPSEALLRLTNPVKFFPHLKFLQIQGYEIVSGGGDVLVFRKVRDGPADPAWNEETANAMQSRRRHINPVDGMQSQPASANFASPTGFVNYDVWTPEAEAVTEPFKSGIDVRREEPVFSGQKPSWQDTEDKAAPKQKKKKTGRRVLVAATWVAGCSYAIGVVADYFRTGGTDGTGPIGF